MTPNGIIQLKRQEGLRLTAYRCPAGKLTVGYGHTSGVKEGDIIDRTQAEAFLVGDVAKAETGARSLVPTFDAISPRRQDAIVNLVFNMGRGDTTKKTGLAGFTNFLAAVKRGFWKKAGVELVDSDWFRTVGRGRSADIITAIREG